MIVFKTALVALSLITNASINKMASSPLGDGLPLLTTAEKQRHVGFLAGKLATCVARAVPGGASVDTEDFKQMVTEAMTTACEDRLLTFYGYAAEYFGEQSALDQVENLTQTLPYEVLRQLRSRAGP
jgi:hypothetical protein